VIALICLTVAVNCGGGDGGGGSLGASFTASGTAATPRLIKMVQHAKSGTHVSVDVVMYGPDTTLDMYTFAFDVLIGDPTVARFVPTSEVVGNALVPFAGQSVEAIADLGTLSGGGTDLSRVVVGVSKLGGGPGNGIAGASAVVVRLTFALQKAGSTTLTLGGIPSPQVLNSSGVPIGSITYDAAAATVTGVSTGGGGY
jgi:hypothetical protein